MIKGERFNSISHLIGLVAALAGCSFLIYAASRQGDPWKIVSFSIYGVSLVALYLFSSCYHCTQGGAKQIFRQLDHYSIYLLIAGTYTPFTLVTLRGGWGWSIFGVIWGLALLGVMLELFLRNKRGYFAVAIYLSMGWVITIALKPLLRALPAAGFTWLLLGGIFYSSGVIFYCLDKKVKHFHGIWHLFVLAGSLCHYLTILIYVS
ncbi:MAG: hemolysin III family protein [Candidatus Wallbacteria bacterium]|nr:hemolysin III family protein [Candidatus Wallbacteria bacterium]